MSSRPPEEQSSVAECCAAREHARDAECASATHGPTVVATKHSLRSHVPMRRGFYFAGGVEVRVSRDQGTYIDTTLGRVRSKTPWRRNRIYIFDAPTK